MGVSFEACLRLREDVPIRRRCYVLLRSRHDVLIRCCGDVPLRRLGDVPSRRRWVFHLRRCWDVQRDIVTTLLRYLVARWVGLHAITDIDESFHNSCSQKNISLVDHGNIKKEHLTVKR